MLQIVGKKNGRNRDNGLCVCGLQICAVLKRHYIQHVQRLFCDTLKSHTTVFIMQSAFHSFHMFCAMLKRIFGCKSGAVVRTLARVQIPVLACGLSLLLVLSLVVRGFSPGTPVFPSHQKPTFPNSNLTRNQVDEEPLRGCATFKSLFII